MSEAVGKIVDKIKSDKRLAIIVIIGIVGILLLTLSELIPTKDKTSEAQTQKDTQQTATYADYEESIEKRLAALVSSISGAGNVKVMVTLDSENENVYAVEQKSNSSDSSSSDEKKYVIINKDGDDDGLLLKIVEPEIRGVAIVCDGADSASVRQEIIKTVTAVLGISSNRVNIAKMKNQ